MWHIQIGAHASCILGLQTAVYHPSIYIFFSGISTHLWRFGIWIVYLSSIHNLVIMESPPLYRHKKHCLSSASSWLFLVNFSSLHSWISLFSKDLISNMLHYQRKRFISYPFKIYDIPPIIIGSRHILSNILQPYRKSYWGLSGCIWKIHDYLWKKNYFSTKYFSNFSIFSKNNIKTIKSKSSYLSYR